MPSATTLPDVIAEHIAAVNGFDVDGIMATFTDDALVNDAHREFWGKDPVRRWVEKEMVGDRVTLDPVGVLEHAGTVIVRVRYDGDYDKTGLPDELIMTNYFTLQGGKIASLFVIRNTPADL